MSTITIRADDQTERALDELTEDGVDRSTAIREAIQEAARRHRAEKLRAEAEVLAADSDDRAEAAAVLRDMESLRAW
jgi:Arc/MetJ-type ribon-helix-helix transcriptional regulator